MACLWAYDLARLTKVQGSIGNMAIGNNIKM